MTTLLASYSEAQQSGTTQAGIARGRAATIGLWIAQIISAGMFLFAGGLKIGGAAEMVKLFAAIGIGQWFRYVTGLIEVTSGLLLLVPSLAFFGAIALMATMVGAIATTGDTNEVDDLCAIAGIRAAGFKTDHDFDEADMRRLNIKRGGPVEDPEKTPKPAARLKISRRA